MIRRGAQQPLRHAVRVAFGGADRLVRIVRHVHRDLDRLDRMLLGRLEAERHLDRHGLRAGGIRLRHLHLAEAEAVELHPSLPSGIGR
jgi:hypothetical protein